MRAFAGIVAYEFRMAIRRWGVWLAFALAFIPYLGNPSAILESAAGRALTQAQVWQLAGASAYMFNFFTPVVAGIAIADRLARDSRLGVRELLYACPLSLTTYVAGKFTGALLAVVVPTLAISLLGSGLLLLNGAPVALLPSGLVSFAVINLPALIFVTAFSLACPELLPVRAYQVLFTGYWFWANYLNPSVMPTLNGTILTPSGERALEGFFGVHWFDPEPRYTAAMAALNVIVLLACAAAALLALRTYLAWKERHT